MPIRSELSETCVDVNILNINNFIWISDEAATMRRGSFGWFFPEAAVLEHLLDHLFLWRVDEGDYI